MTARFGQPSARSAKCDLEGAKFRTKQNRCIVERPNRILVADPIPEPVSGTVHLYAYI